MAKNFPPPRPYQDLILSHEIDIKRSNVWAGVGMGKTVATLASILVYGG